MDDTIDLLQIKIEKAKMELPEDTQNAIAAVPWQSEILKMRETKGYTFEQLGDLELETELLLCGILSPENYPKELKNRMKISEIQVNEIVNEMNEKIFSKIKEELIKNTERKNKFTKNQSEDETNNTQILNSAGIEIVPDLPAVPSAQLMQARNLEINSGVSPLLNKERGWGEVNSSAPAPTAVGATPQEGNEPHPILAQKLSGPVRSTVVETTHSLDNITKTNTPIMPSEKPKIPSTYSYREIPE